MKKSAIAITMTNQIMVLTWRFMYAIAPSSTASATSVIDLAPGLAAITIRASCHP